MKHQQTKDQRDFYAQLGAGSALARRALTHIRALQTQLGDTGQPFMYALESCGTPEFAEYCVSADPETLRENLGDTPDVNVIPVFKSQAGADNYRIAELERALAGVLFEFDDGVNGGRDERVPALDLARTLVPAAEVKKPTVDEVLADFCKVFDHANDCVYDPRQGLWGGFKMPMPGKPGYWQHAELLTANWHGYRSAKGV